MLIVTPTPCKVIQVDLGEPPQPLAVEDRYRAVCLFVRLEGIVLGHRILHAAELPLTGAQMEVLTQEIATATLASYVSSREHNPDLSGLDPERCLQYLAAINPIQKFQQIFRTRRSSPPMDSVSVVVCTHERPGALRRCLQSLQEQYADSLDILVVDNTPKTAATRDIVTAFAGVRYVREDRPGLSYARNCGIAHTRGEFIAFTDDDVSVDKHWIRELLQPFEDATVMATTGLVIPAELETKEQALFEHWLSFHRGYRIRRFGSDFFHRSGQSTPPVWDIGAGANMAFRRRIFHEVGLFDTRLGAGAAGCSEDSEFWYRILKHGWELVYTPLASVRHFHRADPAGLMRQMTMYARGHSAALAVQFSRDRRFGTLSRILTGLPKYHARRIAAALFMRGALPYWIASAWGAFAGTVRAPFMGSDQSANSTTSAAEEATSAIRG